MKDSKHSSIVQATGHEIWQSVLDMVKSLSETMLASLPNFWKIAKGYMDGKYKKVNFNLLSYSYQSETYKRFSKAQSVIGDLVEVLHNVNLWPLMLLGCTLLFYLNSLLFPIWLWHLPLKVKQMGALLCVCHHSSHNELMHSLLRTT